MTTASGVILLTLLAMGLLGLEASPYVGILGYLILPGLFVLGLLLIPLGLWRQRRQVRAATARGETLPGLPVLDFNRPRTRRALLIFVAATAANIVILGAATYKAVQVMDTTFFCGSCHRVMDPEYVAYLRSPHARVPCVDCHIGPGASWFVKSKLSGAWQVVSYSFDLYPRPIPVPVKNLRPAQETCEQCHWPSYFVGSRLKVFTHFADDEKNGETKTVMNLHVGAGGAPPGSARAQGIHAHVAQGVHVRYRSDPSRLQIYEVEWTGPDGQATTYRATDQTVPAGVPWHVMDCIDCHNNPTHIFPSPETELDAAMASGRISRDLPFVHREGLAALRTSYPSHDEARTGIRERLRAYYTRQHPGLVGTREADIEAAAAELGRIWALDVWPTMKITWGTYPSFLGHQQSPGCFRCHDGAHASADGKVVSQDCDLCHNLIAVDEANPAILKELGP